ncbi:RagB/SusD family nutrient uptake outer membrane protein [Persicobacter diffluens]|uniref:Membrane protein n=1 Tax=Persicobacter diffluens TaxID=981 RepID=A0AAN5AN00_9BACT|nr:membrane protein [Persicobacter diffluens]
MTEILNIIKKYSLGIILSLTAFSCNSFLDVEVIDTVSPDTYYKTTEQMEKAVVAAYSPLNNFGLYRQFYGVVSDIGTDDLTTLEGRFQGYMTYNIDNTDKVLFDRGFLVTNDTEMIGGGGIYNSLYEGIMRCNIVLEKLPASDATGKEQMEGEVRFLRALYYQHIVNLWSEGVLVTEENYGSQSHPFISTDEIVPFIEQDLKTIIEDKLLPWSDESGFATGRASMEATKALLARHYLYEKQVAKAEPLLREVINRGNYSLIPVDLIWTIEGDNSEEGIFEVQIDDSYGGGNIYFDDNKNSACVSIRNTFIGPTTTSAYQNIIPTKDLVQEFEEGDLRKKNFILSDGDSIPYAEGTVYKGSATYPYCVLKGIKSGAQANPVIGSGQQTENFPIIRYTDVLLMHAETVVDSDPQTAMEEINQVRARAFGYSSVQELTDNGKDVASYMTATGKSLMEVIKHERRVEFCFEGLRYFDLVRWGDAASNAIMLDKGWSPALAKHYPIPLEDINFNNSF